MTTFLRVLGVALALVALSADARDDRLKYSVKDAMAKADTKAKLDGSVKFYWGKQKVPAGAKMLGTFTANNKTNFFNKSDEDGCYWAWLGAMIKLQERAKREGGNAVVEIKSVYKNQDLVSETEFECGAGSMMGGVALRGTVAKLP
jgi:hypothetical protein